MAATRKGAGRRGRGDARRMWRHALAALLAVAYLLPGSGRADETLGRVQPTNVFVEDDRQLMPRDNTSSSGAVVLIVDPTTNKAGTGFLVSPCLVISAIHIVLSDFDVAARSGPSVQFEYTVYYGSGRIAGGFADFSVARPIAWGPYFASDPVDPSQDWIILQLDTCSKNPQPYFEVSELAWGETVRQTDFRLAGHPRSPDGAPTSYEFVRTDPSCTVYDEAQLPMNRGPLWFHDCATRPGASGAPIYIERETPEAVAIAIGELRPTPGVLPRFDPRHANIAVPLRNAASVFAALAGESHERVAEAQDMLNALGYSLGTADGVAGRQTRLAVYRYRAAQRLPPGALITDDLLDSLRASIARRAGLGESALEPASQP